MSENHDHDPSFGSRDFSSETHRLKDGIASSTSTWLNLSKASGTSGLREGKADGYMGLSENVGYIPNKIAIFHDGIMISKTIGFRGTLFSDTPMLR